MGEASGAKVTRTGNIYSYYYEDGYCTLRRGTDNEIEQFKTDKDLCNIEVATNLVKNGYGEYKDNTNFKFFTYENRTFKYKSIESYTVYTSSIELDTNKKYYVSATIKTDTPNTRYYVGVLESDVDGNDIYHYNQASIKDTLTILTEDLKDGDTIVHYISNFEANSSTPSYILGLIFWNYKDSRGYLYPEETYSRNVWRDIYTYDKVDKTRNTITLKSAWNHGTFKAGTKVSQTNDGNTYQYVAMNAKYPKENEWFKGEGYIGGPLTDANYKFRKGTKSIGVTILGNHNSNPNVTTYYKDIIIKEVD